MRGGRAGCCPASALTVAVTLAAVWLLLGPLDQRSYTGTALYSALYLSNVWFGLNATDYIAAPPETNPFLHLWSLAVEEQFYLAWPLLVLVIWRVARRRAALGFAVMSLASFALTLALQSSSSPQWAFFASPPRAWEFGVGALGALALAACLRGRHGRDLRRSPFLPWRTAR
jgi:peptidoglycan/LPS O-acetylase OafA/YrhL